MRGHAVLALLLLVGCASAGAAQTIRFSGLDWIVREGAGGPGPNRWSADNVHVDAAGALHLRIEQDALGRWTCAEVRTVERFHHGRFEFRVAGFLDRLDPNAVLGLFTYGPPVAGPDGTNEIDVELTRFGEAGSPLGHNTVYPAEAGPDYTTHAFHVPPTTLAATFTFDWAPGRVDFGSYAGPLAIAPAAIDAWNFAPADPRLVPEESAPVHLNFWLFRGRPPTDGQPMEIVITSVAVP